MQFIKSFFRGTTSFFFKVLIIVSAVVAALVFTFNSPKKIEKSLNDSGVYSTFVSGALQEVQKSSAKDQSSDTGSIPINDPAIIAAANQAFTPQLLQSTTENVLNGTYNWLTSKTTKPDFAIDFARAKQAFAQAIGQAAYNRAAGLPVCTRAQLAQIDTNNIDVFKIACRPANLNLAQVQAKTTNDIASSKDFLGTPVVTVQTLPKDARGRTVFDKLSAAPKVYKLVNASPWLLIGLAVAAGLICLWLYESKRRALRNLAIALTVTGGLLLFIAFGAERGFHMLDDPSGPIGKAIKGSFQSTIIKALNSLSNSMIQVIVRFGIAYAALGIVTLVILRFTKPKKTIEPKDEPIPKPPIDDSPNTPPSQPAKPTPKPTSKPVQG